MRFLANENFRGDAVAALLKLGHDVVWIRTEAPGISDAAAAGMEIQPEFVKRCWELELWLQWRPLLTL